jgi:hypothetical protein
VAITAFWFGNALANQYGTTAGNRVDWVTDTIKVALTTSTYTPNQDTHDFFDDVTNEITGTAYSAGGATLGTKSVVYTAGTNTVALKAAATTWATATITARYAVVYKSTGTASTSPLLGYVDLGANQSVTAADFTLTWDSTDGVLKIVAA